MLLHVQAQVEDPALLELRHMMLILLVCVCFCSHAKLRCMCSCNRCTFCICHNLLNSELVRSVKAKIYSAVLNRSLSTALYTTTLSFRWAISNLGFLTPLYLLLAWWVYIAYPHRDVGKFSGYMLKWWRLCYFKVCVTEFIITKVDWSARIKHFIQTRPKHGVIAAPID